MQKLKINTKYKIILLISYILAGCTTGSDSSDSGNLDWKLFRGDAGLSGYTDISLPKNPVLKWTYKSEARTVSSPIIDNGTTYWCDRRGRILGVNLNGESVFDFDLKTAVEATPLIHDSILYIGRIDGFMTAVSLAKKDTIWNYETLGQISASPNLVEFAGSKAIVFGNYDNYFYCLNAENGAELAKFETGYYLNGAAALWEDYILFGGCDSWIRIIDSKKGIQTDSLFSDAYIPASPAIMGNYCYIGDYSGNVYELRLEDGKIANHKKIVNEGDENGSFVSVPAISPDALYFFSGNRELHAINRTNEKLIWKYMLKGNTGESSPLVCGDKIIACTKTGIVSILDANNGKLLWEYDAGEQIVSSPAVIKDHFMILTASGTLFCFGKE